MVVFNPWKGSSVFQEADIRENTAQEENRIDGNVWRGRWDGRSVRDGLKK